MTTCYCGNHLSFEECCKPFIDGTRKPATAIELMKSRFSAYATADADYLIETTHKSTRKSQTKEAIEAWATSNHWIKLDVIEITDFTVTFEAHYIDNHKLEQIHFEKSNFVFENNSWYYVDGIFKK
ncbi:MAG: hypothetical protein H7239_00240 [Flavobacterium sp.]|nr:hypothetical protein [Flavobacterium sp.]